MLTGAPPEEAVVDAVLSDPLGAQILLTALAQNPARVMRRSLLTDLSRRENISSDRLRGLLGALDATGMVRVDQESCELKVSAADALRYAAVLRGVAYSQHRHRDANNVEIVLSPPASPSRLMEVLPKVGFAWARLYDTKDSLIELASHAQRRLVVVSPFLDGEGVRWIAELFAAARTASERLLVVRGRDQAEVDVLQSHRELLSSWNARVLAYSVVHDPALRTPAVETFHAKILLADRERAYIGSANMNRWSRDVSMECGIVIGGPCVRPVTALVDAILSIAEPLKLLEPR